MILIKQKSDIVGSLASTMCLVHCIATPFLFMAQAGMIESAEAQPKWWGFLDMVFLGISFIAIWWSGKATSKKWMRNALWVSWAVLALVIFNEKVALLPLMEQVIYLPSTALVLLHLYNRKYCNCGEAACCVDEKLNS
jgi:hypothetical protein